jgi:hypothetical protein
MTTPSDVVPEPEDRPDPDALAGEEVEYDLGDEDDDYDEEGDEE